MTEALVATTRHERPAFFPAGSETLFGILTEAPSKPSKRGVITLAGSGYGTCAGRNRLFVRLCRVLAGGGFNALRFEYHGVGESTGTVEKFRLDNPFVDDLAAAAAWMREQGSEKLTLVGTCFGATTALVSASKLEGVESLALLSGLLRDGNNDKRSNKALYVRKLTFKEMMRRGLSPAALKGLFERDMRRAYKSIMKAKWRSIAHHRRVEEPHDDLSWVIPEYLESLERAVRKGIRVLMVFGTGDDAFADFQRARAGKLGRILDRAGDLVEIHTLEGPVHSLSRLDIQDALIPVVDEWLTGRRTAVSVGTPAAEGGRHS